MEDTGETFKVEFDVLPQELLREDWDSAAWDHALRAAHEAGVIPVGPIHIETELRKTDLSPLVEGQPLRVRSMMEALSPKEFVHVTATMMVGSKLS